MEQKMNILFIGKRSRMTMQKLLPIYLRVTIDGKRLEASTNLHAHPFLWSPFAGKVKGAVRICNRNKL
jgi:hypothetical protein